MQLGKTSFFTLCDLVLSNKLESPPHLEFSEEMVKNSWYVLRIDFGGVATK